MLVRLHISFHHDACSYIHANTHAHTFSVYIIALAICLKSLVAATIFSVGWIITITTVHDYTVYKPYLIISEYFSFSVTQYFAVCSKAKFHRYVHLISCFSFINKIWFNWYPYIRTCLIYLCIYPIL